MNRPRGRSLPPGSTLVLGVFLSTCDIRELDDGSWMLVNRHDAFTNAVMAAVR
jgi:hypothetical protein